MNLGRQWSSLPYIIMLLVPDIPEFLNGHDNKISETHDLACTAIHWLTKALQVKFYGLFICLSHFKVICVLAVLRCENYVNTIFSKHTIDEQIKLDSGG